MKKTLFLLLLLTILISVPFTVLGNEKDHDQPGPLSPSVEETN